MKEDGLFKEDKKKNRHSLCTQYVLSLLLYLNVLPSLGSLVVLSLTCQIYIRYKNLLGEVSMWENIGINGERVKRRTLAPCKLQQENAE